MNKEVREKLDSYIKLQNDKVAIGLMTKTGFNSRIFGVLKGLLFAGAITEEELIDIYVDIEKK